MGWSNLACRLWCIVLCWAWLCVAAPAFANEATRVSFINPGRSDETYWVMVTEFMQAAAKSLRMDLEVIYLERDHLLQTSVAKELSARAKKPDFVVLVNEKLSALPALEILDAARINTLLILNDLNPEQKTRYGKPREKLRHWIGTITPNNTDAGYKIATTLFAQARERQWKTPELLALSGNRVTPASTERKDGLDRAMKDATDLQVQLRQEFWAQFDELKAYDAIKGALRRYPDTSIIWAANDPMALGAVRAAREVGRVPGKDLLIAGLNWSAQGLQAVQSGDLVASVGGHFATGGWSLVVLSDYASGVDFGPDMGTELQLDVFGVLDKSNVDGYVRQFGLGDWSSIRFTDYTRKNNPKVRKYDFSWARLHKVSR